MPIEPKDVTDGYWYVKDEIDPLGYTIVRVDQGQIDVLLSEESFSVHKGMFEFIAPVPAPTQIADISPDSAHEQMVKLRQALNLPVHASVTEVFRAALALAKKTAADIREENP